MSDDKVTIGGALSYAWALWIENWRAIWGVLAFYALSMTVLYAGQLANDWRLVVAGLVAGVVADFATNGAVFRIAFAKEAAGRPDFGLGALGLQWRGMEWRMVAASLLLLVFFLLVGALAAVAVAAVAAGVMMAKGIPLTTHIDRAALAPMLGPVGQGAIQFVFFVAVAVLLVFAVRLSLTLVASAVSGRVQVLRSAALTRGHFWTVLATRLALWLPALVLGALLTGGLGDISQTPAPPGVAFAIALSMGVVNAGFLAPMLAGSLAYFYRNLRIRA